MRPWRVLSRTRSAPRSGRSPGEHLLLGNVAHPRVARVRATGEVLLAEEDSQKSRFAHPVGAEDGDEFTVSNLECEVVPQGVGASVSEGYVHS